MSKKLYPTDVIPQARAVLEAWKQIDPALTIGDLARTTLADDLTQAAPLYAQLNALEAQFIDLRNRRDALNVGIWDKLKRVRSGVKAIYGDDSSQYEIIGGTRLSERKPRSRKPVT